MAKAFLSHSSSDKPLVEKIAAQLGKNNCHYDKFTFEAGRETLEEIFKGLEDTDIFVLFISDKSLESEWVKKEIIGAKKLQSDSIIDRVFPLLIDKSITYDDPRIPDWIKKPYNIRFFDNEVLILKKIKQFLRESNFKKFSHLRDLDELFVGRHELMQDFERKIINIENTKPACIIVSSFFEGIGRRTFLKNGLIKTRIIDKWYEPIPISINSKESIEDFIYKMSFVEGTSEIFEYDLTEEDLDSKVEIAKNLIKKFNDNNELIFIIDEGSLVLPNHTLVDWFAQILESGDFQNQISFCLVSKFKPYIPLIKKLRNTINFTVEELSPTDTQTLFIQYLNQVTKDLKSDDIKYFLPYLKGIPAQIIYAANLVESLGINDAKRYVSDIEEFDELRTLSIFEFLDDDDLSRQILIALSKFEIISHDLVYRIFGESDEVYESIQKLFDLSLFFFVSSSHEYLKLNSSISDYITRSKLKLDQKYDERIKQMARESLEQPLALDENSDYSEFLFTLQSMIQNDVPIPKKYLIPSFLLKTLIKEYYDRNFNTVVQLANRILDNRLRFDRQIIRETKNWLCLAYCRTQNEKFFEEINYFKEDLRENETLKDFYFLLGFYYRNGDRMEDAERNFLEVLSLDEYHSKAKRELVNVYLRLREYSKALNWARDNYHSHRTNIYHIQAYFTCLVKKQELEKEDIDTLYELINQASKSLDKKAPDILREMKSELNFYIKNEEDLALNSLEESLKMDPRNYYVFRALIEMYRVKGMHEELDKLISEHPDLIEPE
jgi:tetratricopeptide (TPR) repeat protein